MIRSSRPSKVTLVVLGSFVILGVATVSPRSTAADQKKGASETSPLRKDPIPWSKKMQELYKTLADLLTDVTSDKRFNDPSNRTRIQNEADKLSNLVHDLSNKRVVSEDADPTIQIIAGMFGREAKRAARELKHGNRAYARTILRSVPSYCIACHTRNSTGPQFAKLPFEPSQKSLTPLERGEFFTASRQFDRAQEEFKRIIQDSKAAETNTWDWEKAVRQSLAIAVRVKKDPVQAQEIVQIVLKTAAAPSSMKEDAKTWKVSITEWQEELSRRVATEEGLYAEAVRLMAKARETQKYPMDRTADILYLRASAVVHELLQMVPQGSHADEALLLAGLSYEVLMPLKTEVLHEIYYEACVRKAPHTPTAEVCFRRYEEDIFLGYSGSAGTEVPDDIQKNLRELRSLSQPTPAIRN